jgi:hypothetical protein
MIRASNGATSVKIHKAKKISGRSHYDQFLTRANYLLKEEGDLKNRFASHIEARRREWNSQFPEYAIGDPGVAPKSFERKTYPAPEIGFEVRLPMPTLLFDQNQVLEEYHRDVQKAYEDSSVEVEDFEALLDRNPIKDELRFQSAKRKWIDLVFDECDRWWNPRYFPNYEEPNHPAAVLMSVCLLYHLETILPHKLIHRHEPHLLRYGLPPLDESPKSIGMRAQIAYLEDALRSAAAGKVIDPDSVIKKGMDLCFNTSIKAWRSEEAPLYAGVPFSGMTQADWKSMAREAVDVARSIFGDDPKERWIRELSANDGMSAPEIAREIGIDPQTVRNILARFSLVGNAEQR